jgi:hypothetical protein
MLPFKLWTPVNHPEESVQHHNAVFSVPLAELCLMNGVFVRYDVS